MSWRWEGEAFGDTDDKEIETDVNLRFPGQYYDEETGEHYNWNRYYDPNLGRYLESDRIGLNGGINTYGYVGGNPVGNIDPFGLDCVAVNGSVTCTVPGGPTVTFPQPAGWPATMNSNSENYHFYNIPVSLNGASAACVANGLIKHQRGQVFPYRTACKPKETCHLALTRQSFGNQFYPSSPYRHEWLSYTVHGRE